MSKSLYSCLSLILITLGIATFCQPALGQDDGLSANELSQLYGMGVHAYFGGKDAEADMLLTAAIDGGGKDPRAYYFRGLARLRQGNKEAATADFAAGAYMEANAESGGVSVNRSLMRIQGTARIEIETLRVAARKEAAERKKREMEERYNRIRQNEDRVLDRTRGNQGGGGSE